MLWNADDKRKPAEALLGNNALQYFPLEDVSDLAQFIANSKPPIKNMWPSMLRESNRAFNRKVEKICCNLEKIKHNSELSSEMKEAFEKFSKSNLLNNNDEYESFNKKLDAVDKMFSFFAQDGNLEKLKEVCSNVPHDDMFAQQMEEMHNNLRLDDPEISYDKEEVNNMCLAYYGFLYKMMDALPLFQNGMIDLQNSDKSIIGKSILKNIGASLSFLPGAEAATTGIETLWSGIESKQKMLSLTALEKIYEVKISPSHVGAYRPSQRQNITEYILNKHVRHVGVQIAKQLSRGAKIDHSKLIGKMFRSILKDIKKFSDDLPEINAGIPQEKRAESIIFHMDNSAPSPRSTASEYLSTSAFRELWGGNAKGKYGSKPSNHSL